MPREPIIRRAGPGDAEACHGVMWAAVTDFGSRRGTPLEGTAADWWATGQAMQRFLAAHAAEWWVAEEPDSAGVIGFARSIERGSLIELTEFFVLPSSQSRGLGRALIDRAFPRGRGEIRSIIATTDVRALSRYYAAGTSARFPLLTLAGVPTSAELSGGVSARRIDGASASDIRAVSTIEARILEYGRGEPEVRWLLEDREGYLYVRRGRPIGFGFVGQRGAGPIGSLDPRFLIDILLHVEARAASLGMTLLELQVPAPNEIATRHLLARGFRIDPWINLLMSNRPFGSFDRFLGFGPPVFL